MSEISQYHLDNDSPILEVKGVTKSFHQSDRQDLLVLDEIDFSLAQGQIMAILGKSGSGKSTLLRILAGLLPADAGIALCRNKEIDGPVAGLGMVFQDFAVLPWLTVLGNVELGLQAQGVNAKARRERALEAIDIVGMDGFESAYPRELSGGMLQRVGFARALVTNPDILLMDEAFSSLDVLTAENLRNDLLDLWNNKTTNLKGIILVTHNIEEAVTLADKIMIFDNNPGRIVARIDVNLSHPRRETSPNFRAYVDEVYMQIANSDTTKQPAGTKFKTIGLNYRLPNVQIPEMGGLLDTLIDEKLGGSADLRKLAESMHLDVDDLFPITEALEILRLVQINDGVIALTVPGRKYALGDVQQQKEVFARHLLAHIPLSRHVRRVLDERPDHRAADSRFLSELEDYLSESAASEVLKVLIEWGRYAEILAYDVNSGILSLEDPS